mgnify:CR=1 FL=1
MWCPWATGEQPAPPWASSGLQGTSALHLEHLLPSFHTDLSACMAASLLLLAILSQLLLSSSFFPFLNLLSLRPT